MVVVVRRLARAQMPLPWQPPLYWALGLLVWTIVALQSAIDNTLALKQVGSLFGGIIFAASILAACRNMDDLRLILGAFVAVTSGTAGVVISAALMFTLSRGAWIGTALALLFLLVALSEARRALVLLVVPGILVAVLVAPLVPVGQTEINVVGERARALTALSPYDNRRQIYAEAWREIRADPVTGVGPGGFPIASARAGSRTSTYAVVHAHNLLLTWGAEAGFPAVLFILGLALSLALAAREAGRRFRRLGQTRDRAIVAGVAAALLAIFGQGLFDYVLRNAVAEAL